MFPLLRLRFLYIVIRFPIEVLQKLISKSLVVVRIGKRIFGLINCNVLLPNTSKFKSYYSHFF